uniref:C2H2-type domain-containing protein n=1 Tax=Panagrellus redivivus TaxID=6233 RepID=A0A7E4UQX2_PANRE
MTSVAAPPQSKLDPSTGFTCISCRLVFATSALQRDHYQGEWHRYNIKRQVAGLPPISQEQFEGKVQTFQDAKPAPGSKSAPKAKKENEEEYCPACGKLFKSQNAFNNHLNSKKHKDNQVAFDANGGAKPKPKPILEPETAPAGDVEMPPVTEEDSDDESDDGTGSWKTVNSDDEDEDEDYDASKALPSTSCLFCPVKSNSVESNLEHMTVHGFYIPDTEYCTDVEGLLSYLGMKVGCGGICTFCNRRSRWFRTLDAVQKHMRDKQHCKVSLEDDEIVEYLDFYDYGSLLVNEDEGDDNVAINEGYTLILPSGATLGHRSLQRYYKQKLRLGTMETKSAAQNRKAINAALGNYKALGWTGATGKVAELRVRDIGYMKRVFSHQYMKLGIKNNKLFKTRGRADQM